MQACNGSHWLFESARTVSPIGRGRLSIDDGRAHTAAPPLTHWSLLPKLHRFGIERSYVAGGDDGEPTVLFPEDA